ncbi:YdbL family protein [Photobacterium sp. J15]|uniref:YdbL family protein n=1 Tax=Photobacterium sp. J15 TaxID=265901 RepID=UPI0007E469A9|nr:YdbL family protein [Photobacterium sp. J15]
MKKFLVLLFAFFISAQAFALDLQQAKSQGLVGETNTGYVAAVTSNPSPEVRKLVTGVNALRKDRYKKIAVSHGLTTTEVGKLAYKKAIEKTESGHYYQNAAGKWVRK